MNPLAWSSTLRCRCLSRCAVWCGIALALTGPVVMLVGEKFSAEQRAELRDAAARSRVEAEKEHARIARRARTEGGRAG